nr:MAG TPA: Major capsid protein [Caudoviricetes sp.]
MADEQTQQEEQTQQQEAKFTQADLDKIVQTRLSEQKSKFEKQIEEQKKEAEKQAELAKLSEIDRLKAEKDDITAKYQAEADKNALSIQKEDLRKYMTEKEVSHTFLDFLIKEKDLEASKANVDNFKKVFDETVKTEVEKKIPSHVPNTQGNNGSGNGLALKSFKHSFNKFK